MSSGRGTICTPRTRSSSRGSVSIGSARSRRIGAGNVAETTSALAIALGLAAAVATGSAAASCTDNHSVSPWGEAGRPRLADYALEPDLDAHVATIDSEAARLGLTEAFRVAAKDPRTGDPLVAVALEGRDDVGRRLTATRVASPWGVILARGPHDLRDIRRGAATELMRLVSLDAADDAHADPSVGFAAFSDLTRDDTPDLLLRSDDGRLEIWSMTARAGTQIDVRMEVPPTRVVDVDDDGRVDLAGRVAMAATDPLGPVLADVATWAGDAFSNATPAAKAFHARHRALSLAAEATARTEVDRSRRAIEVAWHGILGGGDATREVAALASKRPKTEIGATFDAYVRRVARIGH